MSTAKVEHSPSPFEKDEFIPGLIRDANGTAIASVGVINVHARREEGEANGNLFLSAPDMLAALKSADRILFLLSDEVSRLGCNAKEIPATIKAAIAKATGGAQ